MKYFKLYEEYVNKSPLTLDDLNNIYMLWINNHYKENGIIYKPKLDHLIDKGLLVPIKGEKETKCKTTEELDNIVKKLVGKDIKKACDLCYKLYNEDEIKQDKSHYLIILRLFYLFNTTIDTNFERIADRNTDIINYGFMDSVIEKVLKSRGLKEYNYEKAFLHYFPEPIPEKIKIYRGIKELPKKDHHRKYSSWTYDYKQAERFSKYHFVKHSFSKPRESNVQVILEAEIEISKILIWIGHEESEVILNNSDIEYTYKIIKE